MRVGEKKNEVMSDVVPEPQAIVNMPKEVSWFPSLWEIEQLFFGFRYPEKRLIVPDSFMIMVLLCFPKYAIMDICCSLPDLPTEVLFIFIKTYALYMKLKTITEKRRQLNVVETIDILE
jgi:hypothetical protein